VAIGVVAALGLWWPHRSGAAETPANIPASWRRPVVAAGDLAGRSGVLITRVAVTGAGGLVDLRFKVVDPDRTTSLHDKRTPPAIVDERTGLVVHELFMGHAHSDPFKSGITYYLVFNNPGNWVKAGSRVSVLLGDAQVQHVVVVS
jgi:hypothetical protein